MLTFSGRIMIEKSDHLVNSLFSAALSFSAPAIILCASVTVYGGAAYFMWLFPQLQHLEG
jgi:hypothetical protein